MANQHASPKVAILTRLDYARDCLRAAAGYRIAGQDGAARAALKSARYWLRMARDAYVLAPASTRRRWRAGR